MLLPILLIAGAGALALATTYLLVRRTLFRKQELQDSVAFMKKKFPESLGKYTDAELEETARLYFHSSQPLTVVLAVIGWSTFVLGVMRYEF